MTRRWTSVSEATGAALAGLYPLYFVDNQTDSNKYLGHCDDDNKSNRVPAIVPFDSTIKVVTFSNERTGVDCNIQLLSAPMGTNNSSAVTIVNLSLTNERAACFCVDVDVNACDKLACFIEDKGTNPQDPVVVAWLLPTSDECTDDSDNLSADFPSSGGTTST